MKPATRPRGLRKLRILVVDAQDGPLAAATETHPARALPELLRAGDLVVVNDASTLPASLYARTASGEALELRVVGATDLDGSALHFTAAVLGSGDYRTRTEDRPAPPEVSEGDVLAIGDELVAHVVARSILSDHLVHIELGLHEPMADPAAVWAALYRAGRPVQYAHVPEPLALWDVQNPWAGRPWAVEMPSAGRALDIGTLLSLRARGVEVAVITHAAGVSATGHPEIDARLPLPERFEVNEATARAVNRTRARGGRVIAIGTSVVRALESAARASGASRTGTLQAAAGVTELLLGPETRRQVVDAVLTGVHESDTTHFTLLKAFADRATLDDALASAVREDLLGHEFGDAWLVWGERHVSSQQRDHSGRCAPAPCVSGATVAA
ncbi:MAG: S-adenosylmethionine:tRNA ribosyltransferase-isomerase [Myxococcaceae bacterium]|nr:S-adenosylmethionine:tRNA ribosyltransferase-isomerase [Myxococcaceae bacterium]